MSSRIRRPRGGFAERAAGFLRDWSVPRQLRGAPHETEAAESEASRGLRPRLEQADKVGTSICPYCAVGCAQLVYAKGNRPIHVEGDLRSPINQGTLCPKGAATLGLLTSPGRLDRCLHRAPGATRGGRSPSTGPWTGSRDSPAGRATGASSRGCPTARA